MSAFKLSVVTPVGKVFDESITALVAPGSQGFLGVLGQHAPMVTNLKEGVLKITSESGVRQFKISTGVLEVNDHHDVLILTNSATPAG